MAALTAVLHDAFHDPSTRVYRWTQGAVWTLIVLSIALLVMAAPDRWYWPTRRGRDRWLGVAVVAAGGWLVTAPFHLGFSPPFEGVRPVFAWTDVAELVLYAGCLLLPASLAAVGLLQRFVPGDTEQNRAIVLLGLNAVKNIAISASLAKIFRGGDLCPSFSARHLWKHSIATAIFRRSGGAGGGAVRSFPSPSRRSAM